MGIRAAVGDWIMGTNSVARGRRLVFSMKISEVLHFDEYYNDSRFKKKKPNIIGNWRERVGDNMYYKDNGEWKQHTTIYHRDPEIVEKDLKHPFVFISNEFYYFGDKAVEIPAKFQDLVWKRQGCKSIHPPEIVKAFLTWLQKSLKPGVLGNPADNDETKGNC